MICLIKMIKIVEITMKMYQNSLATWASLQTPPRGSYHHQTFSITKGPRLTQQERDTSNARKGWERKRGGNEGKYTNLLITWPVACPLQKPESAPAILELASTTGSASCRYKLHSDNISKFKFCM